MMHAVETAGGVFQGGAGGPVVNHYLDDVLNVLRIGLESVQVSSAYHQKGLFKQIVVLVMVLSDPDVHADIAASLA